MQTGLSVLDGSVLKIGLTGGIGSGKSSAVAYFRGFGIPVIDADRVARDVLAPESPALSQLVDVFGAEAVGPSGELNRQWLRQKVFAEPLALQQLEAITHPLIRTRLLAQMSAVVQQDDAAYLLVDIPLLFEKNYQDLFSAVVVVDCPEEMQLQRVAGRDGSDPATIKRIMAKQIARQDRLALASHVLDNSTTLASLYAQIDRLHQRLLQQAVDAAT